MEILSVETTENLDGIMLPDLSSVKSALELFSSGRSRQSGATQRQLIADGGGMTAALLTLVQPSPDSFVGQLCEKMEAAVGREGHFRRSFDYDGVGVFFKTTVTVDEVDGGYLLGLRAAYVGNSVEEGLAELLNVPRGLRSTSVKLTLEAVQAERFSVDFAPIATKLGSPKMRVTSGRHLAQTIAKGRVSKYSDDLRYLGIVYLAGESAGYTDDTDNLDKQLTVQLMLDWTTVGEFTEYPYIVEGSVLNAPSRTSWIDESKFENPAIKILITDNQNVDGFGDQPTLDLTLQARMRELAADIQNRLSP